MKIKTDKQQIAIAAATLIYEDGHDYDSAKRKASLGFAESDIPKNSDIHAELIRYASNIATEENARQLKIQQKIALEAMQFLDEYQPLIVGQILDNIAAPHTGITLHLSASTHEEVMFFLEKHSIPFEMTETTLRRAKTYIQYPCLSFLVDSTAVELIIFPEERGHRAAPTSTITDKPMKRLTQKKFQSLIETR